VSGIGCSTAWGEGEPVSWSTWSVTYWTNHAAGWPWLVRRELESAFPGAVVEVVPDPDVEVLSIGPPEGSDPDQARRAAELAASTVERVARATI
jgi:hypothetical protein